MWMQLTRLLLTSALSISCLSFGQVDEDTTKIHLDPIEINIIGNYYEQDGIHSPVTGGLGTEVLNNIAPSVYVHLPLDSIRTLDINAGVDFYSSASSDNIDNPYFSASHVSGASASDVRQYYSLSYSKKNNQKATSNAFLVGFSSEYDVTSFSAGYTFEKANKKKGREFSISTKYFFDDWKLIYPVELRNGTVEYLTTDKRHTIGVTATESFIINKRLKGAFTIDGLGQFGLLSTPFHRVYMENQESPSIEVLPMMRIKIPVGLRLNAFLGSKIIVRTFNRVYWDSWDIKSYTGEIETVFKLTDWLNVYPLYRFQIQTQARYFAPYGIHTVNESFFTSDYDLSAFYTHKYGGGIHISPLYGLARFKLGEEKVFMWKSMDVRYVNYQRSDGLRAWAITAGFEFKIDR
jgi:hypothetical protein